MTAVERAETLQSELDRVVALLSADPRTHRIIVFGSLVSGDVHEGSDLDIVVVMDSDLSFLERLRWLQRLARPRVAVDLLAYTPEEWEEIAQTRPFIREEIAAKGRVEYEREHSALG